MICLYEVYMIHYDPSIPWHSDPMGPMDRTVMHKCRNMLGISGLCQRCDNLAI